MELVSQLIIEPVVKALTGYITQKLRNFTSSANRVKEMIQKMEVLDGQRVDNENRMKANRGNNKEIPARVPRWLEEVENIKKEVEKIPSNDIGCFNVKKKYRAGKNALTLIKDIDRLINEKITWTDADIPLGRVDSKRQASTSTSTSGGNTQIVFKSRDKIFDDALKLLQQDGDDTARVIALCGMGGVGKTTLMKQLKKAAHDNKVFNWIVVVVVGKSSSLFAIQNAIAAHTGGPLTKTDEKLEPPTKTVEKLRADYLSERFKGFLERKEKILVILDDVWEKIKLEDIGFASPLPNGVKLLLTSRDVKVCRQIADDSALEVVEVAVLKENEARDFFCQKAKISAEHDRDLYEIGCEIVRKCGCLPLAIELIAGTLKCEKKCVWEDTLDRLKINDLDEQVQKIIEISYKNLKRQEDKAIFLLCGLFPEDSNIPIEDLTRYAWGLKLLKQVSTMGKARGRTQTSVSNLKNAYLLMDGDSHHSDCVKLHDLVLAFVVNTVSKCGEDGCWIIHHEDDFSNWSEANSMRQSCKQLSLTCKGMSKFPSDFRFPNLSLLKLMHGDESLRAPQDFYATTEKLQVIAFERMEYPVVPTSFQCSTNLRTLCLHECSLVFDLACIGNLLNLEVLSFANSGITILPSTFGNLKELRLLDVTGCYNLAIDDGVLGSLVKLEELYMIPYDEKACCFTDNNNSELAERSKNFCALEFEFIGNNAHMKNVSCEKLKRFKLSVGCSFTEVRNALGTRQVDTHSYENSLKLVTNKEELLKSKINELFKITHALYLQVNDINTLEDVDVEFPRPLHPSRNCSFYKLRILVVSECAELKYLFTLSVATSLSKLEYLEISGCLKMEAVIHTENYVDVFSNLKYLRLAKLPELLHFCNKVDVIELPRLMELQLEGLPKITSIYWSSDISRMQSLFNKEDATPKLEKLVLVDMENLKEIWPPQFCISNLCPLRELTVKGCGSIEVLFNMDFGEIEQLSSSLRSIEVKRCGSLVKLFPCNPFPFLNNLQELKVEWCASVEVIFDIDMGCVGEIEQLSSSLRSITVEGCDSLVKLFSCNPFPFLNNLQVLKVEWCASVEVIFDIDMGCVGEIEQLSSSLRSIEVKRCNRLVKLFSCNPFPFLNNLQELKVEDCGSIQVLFDIDSGRTSKSEEQVCSSSLRSIKVSHCGSLVNLLPSNPMPLFNNLEELVVRWCDSVEVIFDIDMGCVGEMDKVSSSRLRSIELAGLGKLREVWRIKDAGNNMIHGFEAVESIHIRYCFWSFENLITPATTTFDMRALKKVEIIRCGTESDDMVECNQDQEIKVISKVALPFNLLHTFHHIHKLVLDDCKAVEVVFESPHNTQQPPILPYLEELELYHMERMSHVWKCDRNEFLILQKPQSQSSFHNLTTITMYQCDSIKYLFSPLMAKLLSSLKKVDIWSCDAIEEVVSNRDDEDASIYSHTTTTFFPHLDSLNLEYLGSFKCIGGGAYGISTDIHDQLKLTQASWSLCQYAREIRVEDCDALSSVIPWYAVGQMQKLQVLKIINCKSMIEVFESQDINNKSGDDTGKSLPRLKILKIQGCNLLEHIFTLSTLESLPELEELEIKDCESMTEVFETQEINKSGTDTGKSLPRLEYITMLKLPKLKILKIQGCNLLEHIFTLSTLESLPEVEELEIKDCESMTEVFETQEINKSGTDTGKSLPRLEYITMLKLPKLKILKIQGCNLLEHIFTLSTLESLPEVEELEIKDCESMTEVFETQEINKSGTDTGKSLPRLEYITMLKLPKLKILKIQGCNLLEHIFTFSTLQSLTQLEELEVKDCKAMEVIVTEENGQQMTASDVVVFSRLKSLILINLPNFVGFFLGKNEFTWPALEKVVIRECQHMTVFTYGRSTAPKLNFINTSLGKHSVECGLNFHVTTTSHQARLPSYESTSSYRPTTMERLPWSYQNLIEAVSNASGGHTLFSSDKLLQLQKLETVHCSRCRDIEQIFDSETVAEIPNLRQVDLKWLPSLKYIWKSKQGTVLKFPNLTRLSIVGCRSLEYVFTCSMVGSLLQLQELHISWCWNMKVIVKGEEEECDAIVNATVKFPCLKSLKLQSLKSLEGFCLGKEAFEFPSLDTFEIYYCPKMTVFTKGDLSAPKLYAISKLEWCFWKKYNIHNRPLNSVIKNFTKE